MEDDPKRPSDDSRKGRFLHVSGVQFVGSLTVSLVIFFFASGPLWRHAANIGRLDHAIYWSYAAIPFLIAACLGASKRFTVRGFLLDTLALGVTKYVVTASIAIVLWAVGGEPPPATSTSPHEAHSGPAIVEPVAAPTPIDPEATGELHVLVTDANDAPIEGAVVYIASGLEAFVFAAPTDALVLSNDGHGVTPPLAVARVGQAIEGRSLDGRLHTLVVRRDAAVLFNVPLLSSGGSTIVRAGGSAGFATVRCNVHPTETATALVLVSNPFHGSTNASGRVTLAGVPASVLVVAARDALGRAAEESVTLAKRGTAEVRLRLRSP